MRRAPLSSLVLLAVALASLSAPEARAQARRPTAPTKDPRFTEAKRFFDDGAALYTQGNYEAAIDAWKKSYDLSKKPLIFQNIANAYERLGNPRKAREYLLLWRNAAPLDELDVIEARLKNLDARIAREDELEAARKAEAARLAAAAAAARRAAVQPAVAPPPPQSAIYLPGAVMAGAGLVAAGVGVTLDILANGRRPNPQQVCDETPSGRLCLASARGAIVSSNTLAGAGDALWIGGSVLFAGGAALLLTHGLIPPQDAGRASVSVAPAALRAGAGVLVSGGF